MKPYYEHAGQTIYCGRAEDIIPYLSGFDLLLTDPPYGIKADRDRKSQKAGWVDYGLGGWDHKPAAIGTLNACIALCDKAVIWGGNYFPLPPSMGWFVWNKLQREFSLADGELAWTNVDKALRIFDYSRSQALLDGRVHPTQKPIALMKWCIGRMGASCSVLDPYMGSGTTLVAAKDLGLVSTGIDADERCCEIAAKRLSQEVMNFDEVSA